MKSLTGIIILLLSPLAFAGGITFDGTLTDSVGTPITSASTTLRLVLVGGACPLYEETFAVDLSATNGEVGVVFGVGNGTPNGNNVSFLDVFNNLMTHNPAGAIDGGGTCPYSPGGPYDGRTLRFFANDGGGEESLGTISLDPSGTASFAVEAGSAGSLPSVADILDVSLTTLTTGDVLTWNGTNWNNQPPPAPGVGTVTSAAIADGAVTNVDIIAAAGIDWSKINKTGSIISEMGDVTVTAPSNGEVLTFNGSMWVNQMPPGPGGLDSLSDVSATTPLTDDILTWNGSIWTNNKVSTAQILDGTITNVDITNGTISWAKLDMTTSSLDMLNDVSSAGATVGDVLKFDGTNWIVSGGGAASIDEIGNVSAAAPATNDVLIYDGSFWINQALALNSNVDVSLGSPISGEVLVYNGTNWMNSLVGLSSMADVIMGSPVSGETLTYNGTNWSNQFPTIGNNSDVMITSPISGDNLRFDGSNWVNQPPALGQNSDIVLGAMVADEVLTYNGTTWVNQAVNMGMISDVMMTSPIAGESLVFDGSQWVNAPKGLLDMSDVVVGSAVGGDHLVYSGTTWVNMAPSLADNVDTNITSPISGDALIFDGSSWSSQPLPHPMAMDNLTLTADSNFDNTGSIILNVNNADRMIIDNAGNVGIGTNSPVAMLDVAGPVVFGGSLNAQNANFAGVISGGDIHINGCLSLDGGSTAAVGACLSDGQFKENIHSLTGALDKVLALNPRTYDWKESASKITGSKMGKGMGFIAQELEKVFPEHVRDTGEGYKKVNYGMRMQLHLIQAVKDFFGKFSDDSEKKERKIAPLEEQMKKLKEKNDSLKKQNETQAARLEAIEKKLGL